jgi:putative membrane protein
MKKASQYFNDEQRRQIGQAVHTAEQKTDAEFVPCVAAVSGRYDRAEDVVGLWLAVIGVVAVAIFWPPLRAEPGSWDTPAAWVFPTMMAIVAVLGFVVGVVAANRIGWLRRLFLHRRQMRNEVAERARAVFFDNRVYRTADATGILLYVSLYERMAVVLADQTILEKLGPEALQDVCATLTAHLRRCHPAEALCEAIAAAGEKLAAVLPRTAAHAVELPDALVTLDGGF